MSKYIPVEPEKWAEMVKAMALVKEMDKTINASQAECRRLKAEVEAQAKRWAESEDLISHYKQQMDEAINDCQCSRLKAEVERLKEGNDCLGQMHDKEMERSAYLLEEFNRTTAWGRGLESDLSHARVEISFLKAEVERLRYVGDGMAVMVGHIEVTGDAHRMMLELSKEWEAAKEGKSV
ncbi:hypothetical protein UFOVP1370_4 [uncultured Caudovirales phage]|uniref:Uncharacterized protein n=1 Tax=uncultured Caudovirales phage TaxID=2100421 RepID=A0A6J5S4T7_9CAUD|nr:hypothetical protein UFOVP1370_4 [uncultured Caudovirales phage]